MKPDRNALEKRLHQHLGLFGSPSANQIDASRARVRERLRTEREAPVNDEPAEIRALHASHAWRAGLALAALAAVIALVIAAPWKRIDSLGTVEAPDGSYRAIEANAVLRSNDTGTTMVTLKDGSRIEMRAQSELSLERAADGIGIRLRTGGLVVNAARQHGHLYVYTKDMTVAVVGTMFVVNAEDSGSRVTVIEGEVRVRERQIETTLRPGQQVSTSAALASRPVKDVVGWSRNVDKILAAFDKGMAETAGRIAPFAAGAQSASAAGPAPSERGQSRDEDARLEFEEASIRQCDPDNLPVAPAGGRGGGANSFRMIPGRLNALCMTIATLIRTAYGYRAADLDFEAGGKPLPMEVGTVYGLGAEDGRRVRGGPDWVRSERYTIEAVAGTGVVPTAETMRGPMLRRLLEKRLQLNVHIETEQVPAFALTVAKGGLKVKPAGPGACEPLPGREGAPLMWGYPGSVMTPPRTLADVRRGQKPSCGMWGGPNGPNMVVLGGDVPLESLILTLGFNLGGVRIIDRTGVTDRFNYVLEFVVDENAPGLPGARAFRARGADASDVPPASTIFTALEEQLGLKLESTRAPREFILIDRVERPSAN
jgi:uncharacterized protein (TIGR03435 family)